MSVTYEMKPSIPSVLCYCSLHCIAQLYKVVLTFLNLKDPGVIMAMKLFLVGGVIN